MPKGNDSWELWVTSECMSGDPCHCSCALFAGRQRGDRGGAGVRGVEDHQGTNLLQAAPGKQSGKRNAACACISLCVCMCCLCMFLFCVWAPAPSPPAAQPSRTAFWEKDKKWITFWICFCFAHFFTSIFFYWWLICRYANEHSAHFKFSPYTYTCAHAHTHARTLARTHACTNTHTHTHTHTYPYSIWGPWTDWWGLKWILSKHPEWLCTASFVTLFLHPCPQRLARNAQKDCVQLMLSHIVLSL